MAVSRVDSTAELMAVPMVSWWADCWALRSAENWVGQMGRCWVVRRAAMKVTHWVVLTVPTLAANWVGLKAVR